MLLRKANVMQWKNWLLVVFGVSLLWPLSVVQAAGEVSEPEASEQAPDRSPRVPTFKPDGDLAGELQVFNTVYEDTFAAIGNKLALGYLELVKANPGIDPWLPGEGTMITLPRMYVLPDVERDASLLIWRSIACITSRRMVVCRCIRLVWAPRKTRHR